MSHGGKHQTTAAICIDQAMRMPTTPHNTRQEQENFIKQVFILQPKISLHSLSIYIKLKWGAEQWFKNSQETRSQRLLRPPSAQTQLHPPSPSSLHLPSHKPSSGKSDKSGSSPANNPHTEHESCACTLAASCTSPHSGSSPSTLHNPSPRH